MHVMPAVEPNRAMSASFRFAQLPKASEIGALESLPNAFIAW